MTFIAQKQPDSQSGSAFVYILIAIALLAALTASFMKPASQQTTAQNSYKSVSGLKSQIDFARSAIQDCVLSYPEGDGTQTSPYPMNPSDAYLASPAPNNQLQYIGCPGNPGSSNDHARIFSGTSGKYLPPPPDLFEPWVYYNGTDGIFFFIETDKTDAFIQTALQKLDDQYSECEADVIDASGGQVELTSTAAAGDPKCPAGSTCFRMWIIATGSEIFPGDTDGEEAGC